MSSNTTVDNVSCFASNTDELMGIAVPDNQLGSRIKEARQRVNLSQTALAKKFNLTRSAVSQWESGLTEPTPANLRSIAIETKVDYSWLATGRGKELVPLNNYVGDTTKWIAKAEDPLENATRGGAVGLFQKIPIYGHAMGGKHGEFALNGNKISDILAPPDLYDVPDAFAVYIVGDTMKPIFLAGYKAYVHPTFPVRDGDFVVVQILSEERDAIKPLAYVKKFVSMDDKHIRLEQLNPKKILEFPRNRVVKVQKIIMWGPG